VAIKDIGLRDVLYIGSFQRDLAIGQIELGLQPKAEEVIELLFQPLAEDRQRGIGRILKDSFYFSEAVIEKCCPISIEQ